MKKVIHELEPIYNSDSKILILGSFPSVKSREVGFYYGHPKNHFWRLLSDILNQDVPYTIEEKKKFLLKNNIALWDVIKECEIRGSSDNSIKNVICNDIKFILDNSNIKAIFTTGKKAKQLYDKYCYSKTNIEAIYLSSTSPANCCIKYSELKNQYQKIIEFLKEK